jgi:flagellar basal-body rod modification protein FlgD
MNIQGINPSILAPMKAQTAQSAASTSGTSGGSSTTGTGQLSPTNLESTFLNLLATELQNQDPTSPVDPTAMVGQLVSLNQLDQLISINQTLSGLGSSSSSTSNSAQGKAISAPGATSFGSVSNNPVSNSNAANNVLSTAAAFNQFQPAYGATAGTNALMNLYGNFMLPAQTQKISSTGGR